MNLKRVSLVATTVLVVAAVSLLLRRSLFAFGSPWVIVQAAGAALMLWARLTFGMRSFHGGADATAGGLVTNGPYRFIRHPIYTSILLFIWAGVAARGSVVDVLLAIVATGAVAVRIGAEEELVVRTYPEYAEYMRHTKRIIPFTF